MRPVLVFIPAALALSFLLADAGCKAKPSEKACKEAIQNVRRISQQDMSDIGADPTAAIRSCRGNSSKESVECMRTAKTLSDLQACEGEAGEKYFQEAAEETKKAEARNAEPAKGDPTVEDKTDATAKTEDTKTDAAAPESVEPSAKVEADAQ